MGIRTSSLLGQWMLQLPISVFPKKKSTFEGQRWKHTGFHKYINDDWMNSKKAIHKPKSDLICELYGEPIKWFLFNLRMHLLHLWEYPIKPLLPNANSAELGHLQRRWGQISPRKNFSIFRMQSSGDAEIHKSYEATRPLSNRDSQSLFFLYLSTLLYFTFFRYLLFVLDQIASINWLLWHLIFKVELHLAKSSEKQQQRIKTYPSSHHHIKNEN